MKIKKNKIKKSLSKKKNQGKGINIKEKYISHKKSEICYFFTESKYIHTIMCIKFNLFVQKKKMYTFKNLIEAVK